MMHRLRKYLIALLAVAIWGLLAILGQAPGRDREQQPLSPGAARIFLLPGALVTGTSNGGEAGGGALALRAGISFVVYGATACALTLAGASLRPKRKADREEAGEPGGSSGKGGGRGGAKGRRRPS
jgi:hypothetical protein